MARLRRTSVSGSRKPELDKFRLQHLQLGNTVVDDGSGNHAATLNEAESPLLWLARRKGRDGRALIDPHQFLAGERLRTEFTRAQMMPRMTANWSAPIDSARRGQGSSSPTEAMIAARQRVRQAMDAVGPEFSGLLTDVCCFLKSLSDVEGERGWPRRTAKVVLQLGLDRLARHYGLEGEVRGQQQAPLRAWSFEPS